MTASWNKNLLGQTRWRIVSLLRKKPYEIKDLASELDVTKNGIRQQLTTLERDGLVRQKGVKQKGGKPAYLYELTAEAEQLFPKVYGVVLGQLIKRLKGHINEEEIHEMLRNTGKELSASWPRATGDERERLQSAVSVISDLGGLAELEGDKGSYLIRGYSCPLALASEKYHDICILAEVLLKEVTGLELERCCDYNGSPKCRFKLQ